LQSELHNPDIPRDGQIGKIPDALQAIASKEQFFDLEGIEKKVTVLEILFW
jgi:hypothetical protein